MLPKPGKRLWKRFFVINERSFVNVVEEKTATGTKGTYWWRQDTVSNICHGNSHTNFNSKLHQSNKYRLFERKVAWRAFYTFLKYGGLSPVETSHSNLIKFCAAMTATNDSLPDFIYTMENRTNNICCRTCLLTGDDRLVKTKEGGTIPKESIWTMILILPAAASNLPSLCYE